MYYLTQIVKPCASTLCSLRSRANKNAIIWLSVLITNSENNSQAPQAQDKAAFEVERHLADNKEACGKSTNDLNASKSPESIIVSPKFHYTNLNITTTITTDSIDTKGSKESDLDACIPSYLSVSTTEQSSSGIVVTPRESSSNRMSVKYEPMNPQDYSFPHYKSAALLERLNFAANPSDKVPTTPTNRRFIDCPNTAEKLKIAMDVPDLPATPTIDLKREVSHLDLQESLTPEEEYFVTNYELQKLEYIMTTIKDHLLSKGATIHQQYQDQTSLTQDYITMTCFNIELTAIYYYKRFFLTSSVHDYDTFYILLACVLLATKVSGAPRTFICSKPSFFAKLFAKVTAQDMDTLEKIIKETEEWVYTRLGYDLCTTSLLDLFLSEGCQLFFAINNDGDDTSLVSDDSSIKKSPGPIGLDTIIDNETMSPLICRGMINKDRDKSIETFDPFHEPRQPCEQSCTTTDVDLRISSLNIAPPKSNPTPINSKTQICKVTSSRSPIFECYSRVEPSSPSIAALLGRNYSQVDGTCPHKLAKLNKKCIPTSSALCSPTKSLSPCSNRQVPCRKEHQSFNTDTRASMPNPSAINVTKDTTVEPNTLFFSSTSEKESNRAHNIHVPQHPTGAPAAVHARVISDTNINISDLNISNSTGNRSHNSRLDQTSCLLPSFVSLKAVKFVKLLDSTKRPKSTGTIQFWRIVPTAQDDDCVRLQSPPVCSLANSAPCLLNNTQIFSYDSGDVQQSPICGKNKFDSNLSGAIRNKPLLNIYNKNSLTIASSHTKSLKDDMLAPHVSLHQVYSNRRIHALPGEVASTGQVQPPRDPNVTVRFAKDIIVHDSYEYLECEEVRYERSSKNSSAQPLKLFKRAYKKRDRAIPFLPHHNGSPSSGKMLPDGITLSPQAIQYVAPEQVMQKWAPSRSVSLKLQSTSHSTLPAFTTAQTIVDHSNHPDSSTEHGVGSTLHNSLCRIAKTTLNRPIFTEDILLEIPTLRTEHVDHSTETKSTSISTNRSITRRTSPVQILNTPITKLLRISSMLTPIDYTFVSIYTHKRWLKRLTNTRNGIKTSSYACKHSCSSPVHISSTLKISSSSNLIGFIMLRHIHKNINTKIMARFSRDFWWQMPNNPVFLTVQIRNISPISYIKELTVTRKKLNRSKLDSRVRRTTVNKDQHSGDPLLESPSSDYQHEYSDTMLLDPENDTPNTLMGAAFHFFDTINQHNHNTEKIDLLDDSHRDISNTDTPTNDHDEFNKHNAALDNVGNECGVYDNKDRSSISEQMYKLSLNSYQNISLSGDLRTHIASFITPNLSAQNDLLDAHCQFDTLPCYTNLYDYNTQDLHNTMMSLPHPPSLNKTLTFCNISTMSTVLQDQSFSDDHYIKKVIRSNAKEKLQDLISMEFSIVMQYILSTPSIIEYLTESCGLVKFERVYQLAHMTLQNQIRSLTCFGSIQEKKCASLLTPDSISILSFIYAASYSYSLCFKYTDMLLLFSNASILAFLMAESLLLLYNKVIPYVLAHAERVCKEDMSLATHSDSHGMFTMSPANLPLHPTRGDVSSTSKSENISYVANGINNAVKAKILTSSFGRPQVTKQSKKEQIPDCIFDNESPTSANSSRSASSLKKMEKQALSAETVYKILSAKSGVPISRSSLYHSIIGYHKPQNIDTYTTDTFAFRMGGQQHSMISAEDASQSRVGPQSTHTSFDGSRSTLYSKNDTSDDLYSIMKLAFFMIDTYPHHKKLRAHQQNLSTSIYDLKKKHFNHMYNALRHPYSSEPISIKQYMAGISDIFELMHTHVLPRLKSCQYFIKQPGTIFHDVRYWQMVLKLDIDKKEYRKLRSMLSNAPEEQRTTIRQQMNDISAKWNIADDSYWDDSDDY